MANSRREFLKTGTSLAALSAVGLNTAGASTSRADGASEVDPFHDFDWRASDWPITEGPNTPKLHMASSPNADQWADFRKIKQLGVNNVLVYGAPEIPWRDRINHVHYRNVVVEEPVNKYVEVFPDNGQTDMFGFMRELIRQGYTRGIYPEHPRALDYDREHRHGITGSYSDVGGGGYGGMIYNVAYARAMMQAALIAEGVA